MATAPNTATDAGVTLLPRAAHDARKYLQQLQHDAADERTRQQQASRWQRLFRGYPLYLLTSA
ncbi:hypothetical protein [Gemmatimonas sp.]